MSLIVILLLLPLVVFGAALLWPPVRPQQSALDLGEAGRSIDLRDLPPPRSWTARDGSKLAYRLYPGDPGGGIAILIHGSSAFSISVHRGAKALSQAGITVVAPDIRGHGDSGPRGDIAYDGQLEDDLADLVHVVAADRKGERRILVGHSSGGAFVLRVAGSRHSEMFGGFLALSPFLSHDAPTARPYNGNWTAVSIPRIIALTVLSKAGFHRLEGLPVLAFAIPRGSEHILTPTYSFRLMHNFGLDSREWETTLRKIDAPTIVAVGSEEELFFPERFSPTLRPLAPEMEVKVVDGIDHMGMITSRAAMPVIVMLAKQLLTKGASRRRS